jgi:hypothetical protein
MVDIQPMLGDIGKVLVFQLVDYMEIKLLANLIS